MKTAEKLLLEEKGRLYFFQMEQGVFEEKQVKYNSVTWCYCYWNYSESLWTVYCKGRNFLDFYLFGSVGVQHVPEALKLDTNFYQS